MLKLKKDIISIFFTTFYEFLKIKIIKIKLFLFWFYLLSLVLVERDQITDFYMTFDIEVMEVHAVKIVKLSILKFNWYHNQNSRI